MKILNQFPLHDIQALRMKKLKITQNDIAAYLETNRTFVSFALNGRDPVLLARIISFLDEQEANSKLLSQTSH